MRLSHLAILVSVALLAGCGGGGASNPTPGAPAPAQSASGSTPSSNGKTTAGFNLVLSNAKTAAANSHLRRAQFVGQGTSYFTFSVTPSGGSTTTTSYDATVGNTLPQGSTPTTSQPCVYDGNANSERVCTFYVAASPGANHFVVQGYADSAHNYPLEVGATSPDPSITAGATTAVSIALDPVLSVEDIGWVYQGPGTPLPLVFFDDAVSGRVPLDIAAYDYAGDQFTPTDTNPFATGTITNVASGGPTAETIQLEAFSSTGYTSYSMDTGSGCPASYGDTFTATSPKTLYNAGLCYAGGQNASSAGEVYIVVNSGTYNVIYYNPIDVSAAPFQGTSADTITVSAAYASGNLGVDTSTAPDSCPASVATLSAGPYPFSTVSAGTPAVATLTLTPASGVAGGATCELGFTVGGVTVHRIYTYVSTTGSFTVTVP